jgi:Fe-S cluster assembly protein SufD
LPSAALSDILAHYASAARLVERFHGESGAGSWTNAVTEIWLEAGARLDREKLEDESADTYHLSSVRARLAADAVLVSRLYSLGAGLAREEVHVELAGKGAECQLEGLYIGSGDRHVDCQTYVDHHAPHGTSRQDFRGVLGGRARGVFSGTVLVRQGAQKTDARQSNPNLLLSREASADTKPQLEIFADDVQCQHGATVGQIDPEELFYLRSRGLDEAAARGILTLGFAREITRRAEPAWVREYVERRLLETFDFAGVVPDAPAELPSGIRSA